MRIGFFVSSVALAAVAIACASTTQESQTDAGDGGPAGGSSSSSSGAGPGVDAGGGGGSSGNGSSSSGGASSGGSSSSSGGPTHDGGADANGISGSDRPLGDAGGGGDGGAVTGCGDLPLCEDFESSPAGMPPNAATWSVVMGCNPQMQNTPVDGGGLIVSVDGSQAHGGTHSLRVVGGDSCGYYAVNTSAFAKLSGGTIYARFFARFSGAPTMNHNGFLSMATGMDHLRLGFQANVIDWNDQTSDSTLPDLDPQGTTLSGTTTPNTWDCIEFSVDSATGNIQFWLNSNPVQGLSFTAGAMPTQGVNDQWQRGGPKTPVTFTNFGLGWLGLNNQYTAWFDDVALASSRIGCQ